MSAANAFAAIAFASDECAVAGCHNPVAHYSQDFCVDHARITVRAERGEVLVRMEATGDEITLSRESALGLASELTDAAKDALHQHIIASYRQSVKP